MRPRQDVDVVGHRIHRAGVVVDRAHGRVGDRRAQRGHDTIGEEDAERSVEEVASRRVDCFGDRELVVPRRRVLVRPRQCFLAGGPLVLGEGAFEHRRLRAAER